MIRVDNIVYNPAAGRRGTGDLYVPDFCVEAPLALVIHGGGWNHMDKHGLAGIAELLAEQGWAAYNINYRLLDQAPWPACGDDCIAAAEFALNCEHEMFATVDRRNLLIVGASAGGHLALMTGLRMPADRVRAIISIAGPTDLQRFAAETPETGKPFWRKFFGTDADPDAEMLAAASPMSHVHEDVPPVLLMHSLRDTLVDINQSRDFAAACRDCGRRAEVFEFEGNDRNHGIWAPDSDPHRLTANLEARIADFLKTLL